MNRDEKDITIARQAAIIAAQKTQIASLLGKIDRCGKIMESHGIDLGEGGAHGVRNTQPDGKPREAT